jgi:hypothetical protein
MWRRVGLVKTDVSEEHIASIFTVETVSELGTTLAVSVIRLTQKNNSARHSF